MWRGSFFECTEGAVFTDNKVYEDAGGSIVRTLRKLVPLRIIFIKGSSSVFDLSETRLSKTRSS